jgi:hypothetical protein
MSKDFLFIFFFKTGNTIPGGVWGKKSVPTEVERKKIKKNLVHMGGEEKKTKKSCADGLITPLCCGLTVKTETLFQWPDRPVRRFFSVPTAAIGTALFEPCADGRRRHNSIRNLCRRPRQKAVGTDPSRRHLEVFP